jgi:outer membrane protein assembly factor BamB
MHEGPLMKMGDGHWAPEDVRWLTKTLKNMPDPNQPVIFVTHYPIDDQIDNWYVVLDLLKKYNTQAALCGHIHRFRQESFEAIPGVMDRSNLRGNSDAGGYTIVSVQNGKEMSFSERRPGGPTLQPWYSIKLERHNFSSGTNAPRPDFSVNKEFPNVKERWKQETGFTIASSVALSKDLAIVGDASGIVHSFSVSSGKPAWNFKTESAVFSTPDVWADTVVFGSTDGSIYGLKAAGGTQAWRVKTSRPVVASPRINEGVAYIGSSEGKFRAIDVATGKVLWTFDRVGDFVETKPLVYDGKVIFGAWDQYLYALEAKTGKLLWKWKGDRAGTMLSPAACWPVAGSGKVFIIAPDRRMTAIDPKTGAQIWRTDRFTGRESIGISEDQSRVYVRSMQDYFYGVSTSAQKPEELWKTKGGFGYDINSAMLVEKDGALFYGTKNGLVYAINPKNGEIKWKHKIGVCIVNTLTPISANEVIATDFDGRVICLAAGK